MARFTEDQTFSPAIMGASFALLMVVNIGMVLTGGQFAPDESTGEQPSPLFMFLVMPGLIAAFIGALTIAFRLRTRVESDRIIFGFPLGLRRNIPLDEISSVQPVTYRPIRDFGGWGLRFGRMGRMYNARGNRAVRLELANGKVIFVGSQKPEELAEAIASAR